MYRESMTGLPPLAALRAFDAAAQHLSFRTAAEALSVTQSAISHQIAELEQRECLVDPAHCQAAETMIGEWDSIGADMQMFSCRRNRIDTAQGLEALPDFLERNGTFVAAPVFAADME